MKVVFANNPPVPENKPILVVGSDDDVYRFRRKLVIPCSPKLEMGRSDKQQDWATVVKVLEGISWNLRVSLRLRETADRSSYSVNFFVETDNEGWCRFIKIMKLFTSNLSTSVPGNFTIKIGQSVCFNTIDRAYWNGSAQDDVLAPGSKINYTWDVKLTSDEALHLLWAKNSDITLTHAFFRNPQMPEASPVEFFKRLLESGDFSDCEITSKEDAITPCHKVFLIEGSNELKKQIDGGSSQLNLDISTTGVGAFLRFLYFGDLDEAKKDFNLAFELLVAAGSYDVPKLWEEISAILLDKDFDVKTACEGFEMIVKAGKLDSSQDLARKLVSVTIAASGQAAGKANVREFLKDEAVMDTWLELLPVVVTTMNLQLPARTWSQTEQLRRSLSF